MRRSVLFVLLASVRFLSAGGVSLNAETTSARNALVRFCELDARGEQLTSDGWRRVSAFFTAPGAQEHSTVVVIRDFAVSQPALENGKTAFFVEYVELGRIDPLRIHFASPLPPGVKVRAEFQLIQAARKKPGGRPGVMDPPSEWRIEGIVPQPHVTVDAAIRYVTRLRAASTHPARRRNAENTLAALKRLR
jgi:hypothetical protein